MVARAPRRPGSGRDHHHAARRCDHRSRQRACSSPRARIDSFIATLGMSSILLALVSWLSGGEQILNVSAGGSRASRPTPSWALPTPVWILLAVVIVVWYVLQRTPVGRRVYATGGNPEAARLAGVRVSLVTVLCLIACGLITAARRPSSNTARLGVGDPTVGPRLTCCRPWPACFLRLDPVPGRSGQRVGLGDRDLRPGHRHDRTAAGGRPRVDPRRVQPASPCCSPWESPGIRAFRVAWRCFRHIPALWTRSQRSRTGHRGAGAGNPVKRIGAASEISSSSSRLL